MIPLYGGETDPWVLAGIGALWVGSQVYERMAHAVESNEIDAVEDLKRDYEEGRITLAEFEDRVELYLDDRAQETRQRLERIDGIGPDTSATIARQYRTLDELRDATRDDLEAIHGVGPSTSRAINREL
jgi:predicted flap endonuclease-1-like 5' DNA nuclease